MTEERHLEFHNTWHIAVAVNAKIKVDHFSTIR